jgi:hypothetical protein
MSYTASTNPSDQLSTDASVMRDAAWALYNASYTVHAPGLYRETGQWLYQQALSTDIASLFAQLDQQNRLLDAHLQVLDRNTGHRDRYSSGSSTDQHERTVVCASLSGS